MHWNERESYYVYTGSPVERKNGLNSKSYRYPSRAEALMAAREISDKHQNRTRVRVERHAEFFDGYHNEWVIDWAMGGRVVLWESPPSRPIKK